MPATNFLQQAIQWYFNPLLTNPDYLKGYVVAIVTLIFLGLFWSKCVVGPWKRIQSFFKPTKQPATKDGPSPFNMAMGCLVGILLFLLCMIIIVGIMAFLQAQSVPAP